MAADTSTKSDNDKIMAAADCHIFWSTQGGRAKACARRTARILRSQCRVAAINGAASERSFGSSVGEPADFLQLSASLSQKDSSVMILFISTTGDGECCDDMRQTWMSLLSRSLSSTLFGKLRFAVFCLGDRAYGPQFCAAGRKLAARFVQLGAQPFCNVGFGDDGTPDGGVFADLDVWLEQELLPSLKKKWPQQQHKTTTSSSQESAIGLVTSPYQLTVHPSSGMPLTTSELEEEWQVDSYRPHYMRFFAATSCPSTAYQYDEHTGQRLLSSTSSEQSLGFRSSVHPLCGHVVANERITEPDWEQNTRHVQIHVETQADGEQLNQHNENVLPYQAGDVASILPSNSKEQVDQFLGVLPRSIREIADCPLDIIRYSLPSSSSDACAPWPEQCTLRGLLTHCADIHALPEREDLRALSPFCQSGHEMGIDQRNKLISLSETAEAALYADYVLREKRSWADVLYDFDSIRWEGTSEDADSSLLTVEWLLTLLPAIRPRHFSIASAPSRLNAANNRSTPEVTSDGFDVELCVAVVEGTTPLGRRHHGLCSNYLANLDPSQGKALPVRLWIKPGSFGSLPLTLTSSSAMFGTPILCIGAGTGIAPLRSLLWEREAVRRRSIKESGASNSMPLPKCDNILIFGCRKQAADFYYEHEWQPLTEANRLRLLTAFSRDQWHKIYVQQVLRKADEGQLIARHVLEHGGAIYVAGGAKMAQAVKTEIREALAEALAGGEKDANALLKKLQRTGRYSVEAWS